MNNATICDESIWTVVEDSGGEATLCHKSDDFYVLSRVKTIPNFFDSEFILQHYEEQIKNEADILDRNNFCWTSSDLSWNVTVLQTSSSLRKIAVHACTEVDNFFYTIEAMFYDEKGYEYFVKQFSSLVSAINFKLLESVVVNLDSNGVRISILASSNSSVNQDNSSVVLVQNGKYFTVSLTDRAGCSYTMEVGCKVEVQNIVLKDDWVIKRLKLLGKDGSCKGTAELRLKQLKDNVFIEELGYWSGETSLTVADEIAVKIAG